MKKSTLISLVLGGLLAFSSQAKAVEVTANGTIDLDAAQIGNTSDGNSNVGQRWQGFITLSSPVTLQVGDCLVGQASFGSERLRISDNGGGFFQIGTTTGIEQLIARVDDGQGLRVSTQDTTAGFVDLIGGDYLPATTSFQRIGGVNHSGLFHQVTEDMVGTGGTFSVGGVSYRLCQTSSDNLGIDNVVAGAVSFTILADAIEVFGSNSSTAVRSQWEISDEVVSPWACSPSVTGDPCLFGNSVIPPIDDPQWQLMPEVTVTSPSGQQRIRSPLTTCCTPGGHVTFRYYQTEVFIPTSQIVGAANFIMGVDDGAQLTIFNSNHPTGLTPPDSKIPFGVQADVDITPLLTKGEPNRLVVSHLDQIGRGVVNFQLLLDGFPLPIEPFNAQPVALAGTDQIVDEGQTVSMDGQSSFDPDGDPITFAWTQIAGPTVALNDANTALPNFAAPYVSTNQTLTFQLVVNDGELDSDPDTVDVTVVQVNSPPVADAGDDATIKEGAIFVLDGSGSWDPDGETAFTFDWSQISGPTVSLSDPTAPNPNFVVPLGEIGQILVFELIVSDGKEPSVPDNVAITIVENSAPVADAGSDATKDEGSNVTLNGSGSIDPDGDSIIYQWTQTAGPAVSLDDDTVIAPSFAAPTIDAQTVLTFALVVMDDDPTNPKSSEVDSIDVTLLNINDPPACNLAEPSVASLWPPNHKMEEIAINSVSDPDGDVTFIAITGITQDEPIDGLGDGDTSPDAQALINASGDDTTLLRRERDGSGNGRVYQINFNADDGFENCNGAVQVVVPRDRKTKDPATAIDDGQNHDATGGGV